MIDERDLFERSAAQFDPPVDAFDRFTVRRERHERNQRIVAGVVTFVIALALAAAAWALRNPEIQQPAPPPDVFSRVHGWIAVGGLTSVTGIDPTDPSTPTTLSDTGGEPYAWSTDGSHLLVARTLGAETNLYVLDGMGGDALVAHDSASGSFSPDGSSIVYGGIRDPSVFEVPITGGRPRVLVHGTDAAGFAFPIQSPNGSQIVYTNVRNGQTVGLWLMDADGSNRRKVATLGELTSLMGGPNVGDVYALSWSPDSGELVFGASNPAGGIALGLFTVNADGSGLRRITPADSGMWWSAAYSPDGSELAVMSQRRGLLVMAPDGSNARVLDATPSDHGHFVTWNPLPPNPETGP